jgi:hypothetical protein
MNRRKLIFSIILISILLLSACGQTDDDEEAVETAVEMEPPAGIEPVYLYMNCGNETVPVGSEIVIYFEWITETEEQNNQFFDATRHYISIDGIPTSIKKESLGGIEKTEDGSYSQQYWMNIGELEPGTHTIITVTEITEQVFDGWDWYGPDSEYPSFEGFCTVLVGDESEAVELPTPTSPVCELDSPIHQDWNTYLCETFDASTLLWTGTRGGTIARVENGQYVLDNSTQVAQGYTTGFTFPLYIGEAQDYMISVDGVTESIYKSTAWGVFVRSSEYEVIYFFMINNQGRYMLTGSSEREEMRYLGNIDEGGSNAIVWDAVNNITAVAEGAQMEFYVNGELVVTHEAINASSPYFGLIVWGGEGVDAINKFDNLLVRTK